MTLEQIIDGVSRLGALGFALMAVYAFLTERIVPRSRLDEQRQDKKEAIELAKASVAAQERLADAIEAGNRLEEAREHAEAEAARRRR